MVDEEARRQKDGLDPHVHLLGEVHSEAVRHDRWSAVVREAGPLSGDLAHLAAAMEIHDAELEVQGGGTAPKAAAAAAGTGTSAALPFGRASTGKKEGTRSMIYFQLI